MIKILHTADWHIGNFPGPEKDGVNLRSVDTGDCINHLQMVAMLEKPDLIVIAGDLFHQARVWADRGLSEVKIAIRAIEALSEIAPIIVLRGTPNHDGAEQFAMLGKHFETDDSVRIVTSPTIETVPLINEDYAMSDLQVACLPGFDRGVYRARYPGLSKEDENLVFTEELGNITLGLRSACTSNPDVLKIFISHYTIPGSNTESGQTQFLAQFEPVITPEVLDAARFDLVAFGHIHRPQQLKSCNNAFYAGALNAMNFNDEGQDRGFYIHTLEGTELVESKFYKTPHREFATIKLNDDDITLLNNGALDYSLIERAYEENIKDKIVRVIYSCTEANAKTLNKAVLEQRLYEAGAFWVSEITPDKISISVNRNTLDKNDPVQNLTDYMRDKAYTDDVISKAVEVGTPIIDEALANTKVSRLTGIFEPIEITVKNYRNYEEESFSFKDITFCTINGKNGAGKSSLFMDAILDCLYEEPREGDLTGWIRADEKARSGAISFTFKIGEKTFRVARTRAKSGKATLNISEFVNDEWVNRSAEKIKDTQEEIINILGMDSLTFRSCALIMQDQYGLFLQADKESRVSILSNILGLGMYSDMQDIARVKLTDTNREISLKSSEVTSLSEKLSGADDIEVSLCENNVALKEAKTKAEELAKEKDNHTRVLSLLSKAHERAVSIKIDINTLEQKKTTTEAQRTTQEAILSGAIAVLSEEHIILEGVKKHNELLEAEKQGIAGKNAYDSKLQEIVDIKNSIKSMTSKIMELSNKRFTFEDKVKEIDRKLVSEQELQNSFEEWSQKKLELGIVSGTAEIHRGLIQKQNDSERNLITAKSFYLQEYSERAMQIKTLKDKIALTHNAECVDIENAKCRFLADAFEAKKQYEPLVEECKLWKEAKLKEIEALEKIRNDVTEEIDSLDFDVTLPRKLQGEIALLEPRVIEYQQLGSLREQKISVLDMALSTRDEINDKQAELEMIIEKETALTKSIEDLSSLAKVYEETQLELELAKKWIEKEKELPVARERKSTAEQRVKELSSEITSISIEIGIKQAEYEKELENTTGKDEVERKLYDVNSQMADNEKICTSLQMTIGSLNNQLDNIKKHKEQIKMISEEIVGLSERAATLDILKQAFSLDGVPHNIIRSMLPMITATANNILGQMTGGKMGMEFRTEKVLKSNNKKEVVTLDIFIEEYGKSALPYSSKSGGEKVKSALSAILALAETKSTSAGIRLGMLFIDEPPFLDGDGIQAYCDALETIGQRYSDIKIMAITHDPTMKARFPQNLDVIKTENGSKVIFE